MWARLLQQPQDREKFWQTYPTGWHIAIVRRPDSWLHSAEKESKLRELSTNAARLKHWRASVESILEGKKENPDRVIVVEFEDFVANTSDTMCRIAEKLGIRNDATLSIPTFNGEPISSNSSFGTAPPGKIDKTVIDRKDIVEKKYSQQVDDEDFEIYERARNVAD